MILKHPEYAIWYKDGVLFDSDKCLVPAETSIRNVGGMPVKYVLFQGRHKQLRRVD